MEHVGGLQTNGNVSFPFHLHLHLSNYSNSTKKLLEKIILISCEFEKGAILKYPNVNFNCPSKRRLILFSALMVISKKFSLGSKLLQFDWLIEILSQIICKVRLDFALKIVKIEGGLKKLFSDLIEARKLQIFHVLRAVLRREKKLKSKILAENEDVFLISMEKRKKTLLQVQQNIKLTNEINNLRSFESSRTDSMRQFLHIWRCSLNLRLVKSRTRKRVKNFILGRWKKCIRVSSIARIYYGKKVKLSTINRWFSRRFGREREFQLTLKLNEFIARKKRRSMFFKCEVDEFSGKGLFQIWRNSLQERKAEIFYSRHLLKSSFKKLIGIFSLNQGKCQTSRLYNEIRLLKNLFYFWFSKVIPDRFLFSNEMKFLNYKNEKLKYETFLKLKRKLKLIISLEQFGEEGTFKIGKIRSNFLKWNLLRKQHEARLIWTQNFRLTQDSRETFSFWKVSAKNQIISDTKYQFNLGKNYLNFWRKLFEHRQEGRFQLKRHFSLFKIALQSRRGLRFLNGQKLLRQLTRFKASNQTLSKALNSEDPEKDTKLLTLFKWKHELKRVKRIHDCGNVFLLEKLKKFVQIWRLEVLQLNLISNEPLKLKSKTFSNLKKGLLNQREKCELLDKQLFHFYTNRAVHLENLYFQRWESAFQVLQVGEHCCLQVLKLWDLEKRKKLFRTWQVQTAGIIFTKCKRITEQQATFSRWRKLCNSERERRTLRIVSKHFQLWTSAHRERNLGNIEINFRHLRTKQLYFSKWKSSHNELIQSWSRASDFFYIVKGAQAISLWKDKLEALRLARKKTQTLLFLRAPLVRKPRIEQILANAASLTTDHSKDEGNLIMKNLNISELSIYD